jgi:hypothetical protein
MKPLPKVYKDEMDLNSPKSAVAAAEEALQG